MFGPRTVFSGLSFGKVLGGISKTLGVVNQIIPLYKEAKPMIDNARSAISIIKELGNTTTTKIMNNTSKNLKPIKEKLQNMTTNITPNEKGPTFFQ